MMGSTIEAAGQETVKVGPKDAPEWRPKYKMSQLLDPEFRLPAEEFDGDDSKDFLDFLDNGHVHGLKYDEVR